MASSSEIVPLTHLVVIPDGNRRWAKSRNLPAWEGHRRGAENTRQVLDACKEKNVKYLTLWGFSTENWKRDKQEVDFLMKLFKEFLVKERDEMIKSKVRFRHLGRKDRLDSDLLQMITSLENETNDFSDWHLQIALDYGGRDEIVRATQKILASGLQPAEVTLDVFANYLDTAGIPDPDLIVRTSGEQRLSGMMPFQGTYAELTFVPLLFPDFTKDKVLAVIDEYYQRQRRFGGS